MGPGFLASSQNQVCLQGLPSLYMKKLVQKFPEVPVRLRF